MVDYEAVTSAQQRVWATGDFHRIGVAQLVVGELLVRALRVRAGERVLDVASGSGNTALAAARRFADVLASDYVPDLLGHASARAAAEGLDLRTDVADVQRLPYPDAGFDVVTSTFGAMFAPDQERTATELLRVLRPGGRLGLACWTETGFVAGMFATTARHAAPPPGLLPPSRWGTEEGLQALLGERGAKVEIDQLQAHFTYPSPDFMVEYFRTWFGPTAAAFARLDAAGQEALSTELRELIDEHNRATDGTVLIEDGDYAQIVATKP